MYSNSVRSRRRCHWTFFTAFGSLLLDHNLLFDVSTNISFTYVIFQTIITREKVKVITSPAFIFTPFTRPQASQTTDIAQTAARPAHLEKDVRTSYFEAAKAATYLRAIAEASVKLDETGITGILENVSRSLAGSEPERNNAVINL